MALAARPSPLFKVANFDLESAMINESLFSNLKKSNSRTDSDFESSKFEGLVAIAMFKAADFMKI